MKLLFVTDGIYPLMIGGMQKHSTMLLKYLAERKVQITLIHSGNQSGTSTTLDDLFTENQEQIRFIELPFVDHSKLPGHYIRANKHYSQLAFDSVKDEIDQYDVIYCKGFTAYAFLKARKDFDVPICCKLHGYEMYVDIPGLIRKIQQAYLRKIAGYITRHSDHVFSYGGKITDLIQGIGVDRGKILECPGGIEAKWLRKAVHKTDQPIKFLFVGRYERRKGVQEIQASLQLLQKEGLPFEIQFVGPIPKEQKFQSDHCIYHGMLNDPEQIKAIYDESDILLCPSYAEGMPNVIFEAMSRGLAIIGTDVGAVAEQVKDNGWLIPAGSVEALLDAMKAAIASSPAEIDKMKAASQRMIETTFTWEKVTDRFIQLLKDEVISD